MEPIAVVNWIDDKGIERTRKCYTQFELNNAERFVRSRMLLSWTLLCDGRAYKPPDEQKRQTGRLKIV